MKMVPATTAATPAARVRPVRGDGHGRLLAVGSGRGARRCPEPRKRRGDRTSPRDVTGLVIRSCRPGQSRPSSAPRLTAARRVVTSSLVKMWRVWVRSVLTDTNSRRRSPARSGRSASSRSTSSSRSLSPPAPGRDRGRSPGRPVPLAAAASAAAPAGSRQLRARPADARSRSSSGRPLVEEHARRSRRGRRGPSAAAQVVERRSRSPRARWARARTTARRPRCRPVRGSGAATMRSSSPGRRRRRLGVPRVLGDQQPGQGEVVVLGRYARCRPRRTPCSLAQSRRPRPALGERTRARSGRHRPHVGEEAGPVQRLGPVEHPIAPSRSPWARSSPAMAVYQRCRFSGREARSPSSRAVSRCSAAASSSPCSRRTSASPTCRSPVVEGRPPDAPARRRGPARRGGAPRRVGRGQPHAGEDHGRAELVGHACPPRARLRTASVKVSTAASGRPSAQAASPRNPAAAPRAKWSSGPASSRARRAWTTVPATSPRAWATEAR